MTTRRILVVHRRSTYTTQIAAGGRSRIVELARAGDPLVDDVVEAHENHLESMELIRGELDSRGLEAVWRHNIGDIVPDDFDLVITVGGDGTVLHASHAINQAPVLAVNSSPSTSVGFLTCASAYTFGEVLDQVLAGEFEVMKLYRMKVEVNDKVVTRRALNDVLFCHDCPASTTRYLISHEGRSEMQLSSGVWISTAAGSTAAIRAAGGRPMPPRSQRLQFVVREAYPFGGAMDQHLPQLLRGFVGKGEVLTVRSKTKAARLYVDGPHVVFPVDFGDVVTLSLSDEPLSMYGYQQKDD